MYHAREYDHVHGCHNNQKYDSLSGARLQPSHSADDVMLSVVH